MNTARKLGIISVVALCTAITVQPGVGCAEVLGTYRLTFGGGSRVAWTELPIYIRDNPRPPAGPEFYVNWTAGPQHIGETLFISTATHEDFDILAGLLTNGQADYMQFGFGGSGTGGTECALFIKSPGVAEEACDYAGHTVTAMSLTIHALTLDVNPSVPWTEHSGDVTFTIHGKYGGGNGTAEYPYQIWDANHMQAIGADPCDWDKHFVLMADIDLGQFDGKEGRERFNIIGIYVGRDNPYSRPFTGVFDGDDHTVSNFIYDSNDRSYVGLFEYVNDPNAEIKNLGVIDPNVDGGSGGAGLLVGYLSNGTIANCYAEGGTVSGYDGSGGLVTANDGTITNCYSTSSVTGRYEAAGGLVGFNAGTIMNCNASGSVLGPGTVGGLVGYNIGAIIDCYATGDVSGWGVGGLAGENWGTITNSYSTGDVNGHYVGGLVGWNYEQITTSYSTGDVNGVGDSTGGLAGINTGSVSNSYSVGDVNGVGGSTGGLMGDNSGSISDCYSTGSVAGYRYVGGLVGKNWEDVLNSFWDIDAQTHGVTESIGENDGGTVTNVLGLPTFQLHQQSTFTNWDFIGVWDIGENQTYPYLRTVPAGDINKDETVNFLDVCIIAQQWCNEE